jgi:predicted acetyltransferase
VARDASGTAVASCLADLRVGPPGPWNPTGKIAYLHTVSTMPPFRRRGLARTLTTNLLDRLRELDIPVVDLHATPQGRPLYEALGFTLREPQNEMRLRLQEPEAF